MARFLRPFLPVLLDLVGFALVSVGVGLIYLPAGVIVAGASFILGGLAVSK